MSTLPTEPTTSLQKTTKQEKNVQGRILQGTTLRSISYAIVTAALGAALAAAVGGSVLTIITSIIISGILGIAFAIIQGLEQHVQELEKLRELYISEIVTLSNGNSTNENKVSKLINDFDDLVEHAANVLKFYETLQKLLDGDYPQKLLIRDFLERTMKRPIFTQPMDERIFFQLAEKGIEQCMETWQAIHHGAISELTISNLKPYSYLQQLKVTEKPLKKQRIVILDGSKQLEELKDYDKIDNFLRITDGTVSYWISKDRFFKEFELPNKMRLDDAALHDGRLLILRQRETNLVMMALEGQGDRACEGIIEAFNRLNFEINHDHVEKIFELIVRPKQPVA